MRPIGKIKIVDIIPDREDIHYASGTAICEDSEGNRWEFLAIGHQNDLQPFNPLPKFKLRRVMDLKSKKELKLRQLVLASEFDHIRAPIREGGFIKHRWTIGRITAFKEEGVFVEPIEGSPGDTSIKRLFVLPIEDKLAQPILVALLSASIHPGYF